MGVLACLDDASIMQSSTDSTVSTTLFLLLDRIKLTSFCCNSSRTSSINSLRNDLQLLNSRSTHPLGFNKVSPSHITPAKSSTERMDGSTRIETLSTTTSLRFSRNLPILTFQASSQNTPRQKLQQRSHRLLSEDLALEFEKVLSELSANVTRSNSLSSFNNFPKLNLTSSDASFPTCTNPLLLSTFLSFSTNYDVTVYSKVYVSLDSVTQIDYPSPNSVDDSRSSLLPVRSRKVSSMEVKPVQLSSPAYNSTLILIVSVSPRFSSKLESSLNSKNEEMNTSERLSPRFKQRVGSSLVDVKRRRYFIELKPFALSNETLASTFSFEIGLGGRSSSEFDLFSLPPDRTTSFDGRSQSWLQRRNERRRRNWRGLGYSNSRRNSNGIKLRCKESWQLSGH